MPKKAKRTPETDGPMSISISFSVDADILAECDKIADYLSSDWGHISRSQTMRGLIKKGIAKFKEENEEYK